VLLVVGQVDGDASITTGSPVVKTNEELLFAVRAANPDAYIIFKPHPDVTSGNRSGQVSQNCMAKCVDQIVTDLPLTSLYPHVEQLHTMTSLSGFEALIHNINVHCWGQPFYSGWGLTTDHYPQPRRQRKRTLAELYFIALVEYPVYIDWGTKLRTKPEWLITQLAKQKQLPLNKQSRKQRILTKLKHLAELLF